MMKEMNEEKLTEDQLNHKKMGIEYFNYTWGLIDKNKRTQQEVDEMIHAAHSSRFHWGKLNQPINNERGEWQISRVYSILNRFEPALYHAERCLDICLKSKIGDFDLAFAYEAIARAYAINNDKVNKEKYLKLAKEAGDKIAKKEDKDYFFSELKMII
jgi:hypothetical protein